MGQGLMNEINGTATLIGDWNDEAMATLKKVTDYWVGVEHPEIGPFLVFDGEFSKDALTQEIWGDFEQFGGEKQPLLMVSWSWLNQDDHMSEWHIDEEELDSETYDKLVHLMEKDGLSIFFYVVETYDYCDIDGSEGADVGAFEAIVIGDRLEAVELSESRFEQLFEKRQASGFSDIYEGYHREKVWDD